MNPKDAIAGFLSDHQCFHSDLQVDQFITYRAGGTRYGMYQQAVRELISRLDTMATMFMDLEEAKANEVLARSKLASAIPPDRPAAPDELAELRLAEVKVWRQRHKQFTIERYLKDMLREANLFYGQALALKAELGELTDAKRSELDREAWRFWIRKEAALDFVQNGRGRILSRKLVELIWSFPAEEREALKIECTADPDSLVREMETREPRIPWKPAALTLEDVREGIQLDVHRIDGTHGGTD